MKATGTILDWILDDLQDCGAVELEHARPTIASVILSTPFISMRV